MATVKLHVKRGFNHFTDKEIYYLCTKQTGTLAAADLVENIVRECRIPRLYAEGVLSYLAEAVFDYMKAGMAVQVPGLGTLKLNVTSRPQPTRREATADTVTGAKLQLIPLKSVKQQMAQFHYEVLEEEDENDTNTES